MKKMQADHKRKKVDLLVRARAAHCYCGIMEAIKKDGGLPFLIIIRRNMAKLIAEYERKFRK